MSGSGLTSGEVISEDKSGFFIIFSFLRRCQTCADKSNRIFSLGVNHDKQTLALGLTEQRETLFLFGMNWVRDEDRKRVAKNSGRFWKGDPVFVPVASGFSLIPLKAQFHKYIPAAPL